MSSWGSRVRRLPVQPLRGSDPTLLEIQLNDMVRRPLGQIAPVNIMDLVELAETQGRPAALDKALQTFVEGVGRQIADIPKGRSWDDYLTELEGLPGRQVPHRFRQMLELETTRDNRAAPRVRALLERWNAEPPEPFALGLTMAKVIRSVDVPPPKMGDGTGAPREKRSRARARTEGGERGPIVRSAPRPKVIRDIDRFTYIQEQLLERLARATEHGLAEAVLVAGVRHAAKESYPDLTPVEVTGILRQMRDGHVVRYSAGRWSLQTRF
jgi:hypothetical protein